MLDDDGDAANCLGADETYIRATRNVSKEHKRTSDPLFSYALSTNTLVAMPSQQEAHAQNVSISASNV